MYSSLDYCGKICAQSDPSSTAIFLKNLPVESAYNLYPSFGQFIHNIFTPKFKKLPLLISIFTRNTQSLLLKLLIY